MLSRALTKPRKSPKEGDYSFKSSSIHEYDDYIIGFMEDLPSVSCDGDDQRVKEGMSQMTLREVLRASVGVMGESRLAMTEKVVLWEGKVCVLKRFRKVIVRKSEFGRRIERLSEVGRRCQYLVPVTAYLYSKRIKFVVFDYYPMGSLADLLYGSRELNHTALDWNQRLLIILNIVQAIAFIHSQCPPPTHSPQGKCLQMNVHGNIRPSNVMINMDFTACVSDYGFTQLAERVEVSDTWQQKLPPEQEACDVYCDKLCQKSDIYNFGILVLDMLGGPRAREMKKGIAENKEKIGIGEREFFEFHVEGKERQEAMQVLDLALKCTYRLPEARPSIDQALQLLGDVIKQVRVTTLDSM